MKNFTFTMAGSMLALLVPLSRAYADTPSNAHVGTLEYLEGETYVDGQAVAGTQDKLPILDNGQTLSTGKGHAEMILTPGVFLRLDSQSAVRLVNASLTDTRLSLDRGAAILEVDDLHRENQLRIDTGSGTVTIVKDGLYRFNASPAEVQVFQGKAVGAEQDSALKAGKHREIAFGNYPVESKFTNVPDDDLSRWSRLRSEYEAEAAISSAQYVVDAGWGWDMGWFWNPWFSTWTWFPGEGMCMNPYGFGLFSPWMVYNYFPMRYYGGMHRYGFAARTGPVSPSGLNLQRGSAMRAAQYGRAGMGGFRGYGGPRASMGGFGMGRSMGGAMRGGMGRMGGGRR